MINISLKFGSIPESFELVLKEKFNIYDDLSNKILIVNDTDFKNIDVNYYSCIFVFPLEDDVISYSEKIFIFDPYRNEEKSLEKLYGKENYFFEYIKQILIIMNYIPRFKDDKNIFLEFY